MSPAERATKRRLLCAMLFMLSERSATVANATAKLIAKGFPVDLTIMAMPTAGEIAAVITPESVKDYLAQFAQRAQDAEALASTMGPIPLMTVEEALETNFGALADRILNLLEPDAAKVDSFLASLNGGM